MTILAVWAKHVAWRLMPSSSYWRVALEWEKRKAVTRKSHHKTRTAAIEAGLCPQCCKVRPNKGHVLCSTCRASGARAQRRHRERRKADMAPA